MRRTRNKPSILVMALVGVLALVGAACGDDTSDDVVAGSGATAESTVADDTSDATVAPTEVPAAPVGWSDAPTPVCPDGDHALGPDGVLWVGSLGLYRWDGEWTYFTHEDGLPAGPDFDPDPPVPSGGPCGLDSEAPAVSDVEVAPDGTVWIANGAGISTFDGEEFTVVAPYPGGVVPETFGGYLAVDGNGDVWFPTFERVEEVLTGVDPSTGEPYLDPETGEPVVDVSEPLTGIARLDGETWTEYPLGVATNLGDRPLVGDDGSVYFVGTDAVSELVDGTWSEVDVGELLALGRLYPTNATVAPDGSLWMAVAGEAGVVAVAHRTDGEWTVDTDVPAIFGQMIVAPDGILWAPEVTPEVALRGLAAFDGSNWTTYEVEGVEPTCPPFFMLVDGTSIWVRGPGGCSSLRFTPAE